MGRLAGARGVPLLSKLLPREASTPKSVSNVGEKNGPKPKALEQRGIMIQGERSRRDDVSSAMGKRLDFSGCLSFTPEGRG